MTTPNLETLFDAAETLSPRLQWMKKHDIKTEEGHYGKRTWKAYVPTDDARFVKAVSYANSEDEALSNIAFAIGVPMWNEEGLAK